MTHNHLQHETSPYLRQHSDNPVDWYPWGDDAFARAKTEDKPVLLSIGYGACHWCHVMAHESFEDSDTARFMNEHFISIKVDREERPDVDKIYMDALHALGEHGGWPLTMFLTPDGTPFWGGTYFPKTSQYGRPSFLQVLSEIARIWRTERDKIETNRSALMDVLSSPPSDAPAELSPHLLTEAARHLVNIMDLTHGGLRGAPKFPQCPLFELLRRNGVAVHDSNAERALDVTLRNICQGGIYDHLGGGFARYSVDAEWLVPHFEKMLYDNAQLITQLARHWTAVQNPLFRIRIEETVGWTLREMRTPEGAFAASYDADSEGEEGRYYLWTEAEIEALLAPDHADLFKHTYGVTPTGNFEGRNILNRLADLDLRDAATEASLADAREILLKARDGRVPPAWDDKVLADWNGLMISTLAEAGLLLRNPRWVQEAGTSFNTVLGLLWKDGTLYHSWRSGTVRHHATADGYANLIAAAIQLHEATGHLRWIEHAEALLAALDASHWDITAGGYYFASSAADHLIVRSKFAHDDAMPNANAVMLSNLAKLHLLTGCMDYREKALAIENAFASSAGRNLFAHATFLAGVQDLHDLVQIILLSAPDAAHKAEALQSAVLAQPLPNRLILRTENPRSLPEGHPAHARPLPASGASLYLCRGNTCSLPVTEPHEVPHALAMLDLGPPAS